MHVNSEIALYEQLIYAVAAAVVVGSSLVSVVEGATVVLVSHLLMSVVSHTPLSACHVCPSGQSWSVFPPDMQQQYFWQLSGLE